MEKHFCYFCKYLGGPAGDWTAVRRAVEVGGGRRCCGRLDGVAGGGGEDVVASPGGDRGAAAQYRSHYTESTAGPPRQHYAMVGSVGGHATILHWGLSWTGGGGGRGAATPAAAAVLHTRVVIVMVGR